MARELELGPIQPLNTETRRMDNERKTRYDMISERTCDELCVFQGVI